MTVGGSIFLIAVGAIIRYALTIEIAGVNLDILGLILMVAGIAGLLIGLAMIAFTGGGRGDAVREREARRPPR